MNQNEEFNFNECRRLFNHGMLKDHLDVKNYIQKFFTPLISGQHVLIENNNVTLVSDEIMRKVFMRRWDKKISQWYDSETIPKNLICDFNKPIIGDKFINVSKQLKHQYQEYQTFDDNVKKGVDTMLGYIKEVWANNDNTMFNYILNWLSETIKGNKNKSCLYAKSIEGVGKSTLPEFLRDYAMGNELFLKGKSDHLKGQHNMQMLGKILVVFEELQIFSDKEWHAIDSELKDLITDEMAQYTDKYEKMIQAKNTNNYIILTNFDLKGAHGRRMCVLEINTKYLNNFEYFSNLRKECFNDKVGHAFYCYLKEIDTTNFQSNIIPETQTKRNLYLHLLPAPEKFLKKFYVLRHAGINMKCSELYDLFVHSDEFKQGMTNQSFYNHLGEIGFTRKVVHKQYWYKITYDELLEFGKKRKWFDEILDKELFERACICEGAFDNEDETKIYVDKHNYLELTNKVEILENKIKVINDQKRIKVLSDKIKQLFDETLKNNDVLKLQIDYTTLLEKKYKSLKENVNDIDMRVASLENEQMNSDESESEDDEYDDSDECKYCGWYAELEDSHIKHAAIQGCKHIEKLYKLKINKNGKVLAKLRSENDTDEEESDEEEDKDCHFREEKKVTFTQIADKVFVNDKTHEEFKCCEDDEIIECDETKIRIKFDK